MNEQRSNSKKNNGISTRRFNHKKKCAVWVTRMKFNKEHKSQRHIQHQRWTKKNSINFLLFYVVPHHKGRYITWNVFSIQFHESWSMGLFCVWSVFYFCSYPLALRSNFFTALEFYSSSVDQNAQRGTFISLFGLRQIF